MDRLILTRRECVALAPLAVVAACAGRALGQPEASAPDSFPAQDPALVREIVGASHGNIEKVTALLKQAPQLANATYDWGFGDWETALGAASHTGRRQIAELLMQHGARPDIFTFAMLGHLDAVRAMVAVRPGIQRTRGPHGITLLSHARAGGEESKPVVEYLTTLGDADVGYESKPLTGAEQDVYKGEYKFGPRDDQRLSILIPEKQTRLAVQRGAGPWRGLTYLGQHTFHPAGAPDVRLAFSMDGGKAVRLTVTSPAPVLVAERV